MNEVSGESRPGESPAESPAMPPVRPLADRPSGDQPQVPQTPPTILVGQQGMATGAPPFARATSPGPPDRVVVHLIWEGMLLVITAALVVAALATTPHATLADIIRPAGYIGLLAAGLALSLRTGTPNLAVGSIATATGVFGAHLADTGGWSLPTAMTVAVVVAAAVGLVAGLIVAVLSVPAWAVTLALALLLQAVAGLISSGQILNVRASASYPTALWLGMFVVISLGGGALWLVPRVRTALSATRSATEPGRWAGPSAGLGAVVGLTGSSLLAGVGGVAFATYLYVVDESSGGLNLTIFAFAAVLVGGVSVFGRRAGVLGTVLGVAIVATVLFLMTAHVTSSPYWLYVAIGGLALFGLGVSRALESITDTLNRNQV